MTPIKLSTRLAEALIGAIKSNNNVLVNYDDYATKRLLKLELVSQISPEVIKVNDAALAPLRAWYQSHEHVKNYANTYAVECERVIAQYRFNNEADRMVCTLACTCGECYDCTKLVAYEVTSREDEVIDQSYQGTNVTSADVVADMLTLIKLDDRVKLTSTALDFGPNDDRIAIVTYWPNTDGYFWATVTVNGYEARKRLHVSQIEVLNPI